MTGTVFDLKRFAVHDGGGIRSTLFLKGCPLRCPWCQNPEGLRRTVRLWHQPSKCVRCGTCAAACPNGALSLVERVHIDPARCERCGRCVDACPAGAMELDGREITAEEAAQSLLRDLPFFQNGGGVTLSGGEVMAQPDFALEVLRLCREGGAGTAIESCLYTPWETVERFLPVVDQFLVDIKYFDAQAHRAAVGVENGPILENIRRLAGAGAKVTVRTPLIPGYTAAEDNIRAIARFTAELGVPHELLNFNPLCRSKYAALEEDYPVEGGALGPAELERFYDILRGEGVQQIVKEQ